MENKMYRPCARKEGNPWGTKSHKSCMDCEHIMLGGQFNRVCMKNPKRHLWAMRPVDELRLRSDFLMDNRTVIDGWMEISGQTQADACVDYKLCSEHIGKEFQDDPPEDEWNWEEEIMENK